MQILVEVLLGQLMDLRGAIGLGDVDVLLYAIKRELDDLGLFYVGVEPRLREHSSRGAPRHFVSWSSVFFLASLPMARHCLRPIGLKLLQILLLELINTNFAARTLQCLRWRSVDRIGGVHPLKHLVVNSIIHFY